VLSAGQKCDLLFCAAFQSVVPAWLWPHCHGAARRQCSSTLSDGPNQQTSLQAAMDHGAFPALSAAWCAFLSMQCCHMQSLSSEKAVDAEKITHIWLLKEHFGVSPLPAWLLGANCISVFAHLKRVSQSTSFGPWPCSRRLARCCGCNKDTLPKWALLR